MGFANPVLLISVPIFFVLASIVLLPFEKKLPFIKNLIVFVPLVVCAINLVIICLIGGKVFSGSVVLAQLDGFIQTICPFLLSIK